MTISAFRGTELLASGPPEEVAIAIRRARDADPSAVILAFDDATGHAVDFDLSGDDADIVARHRPAPAATRPAGRPRLGVVAREVTLLPRHWEWLGRHPGGASAMLRRLVEAAMAGDDGAAGRRAAADRFLMAVLGDAPGYEEAARALYAGDMERFSALSAAWPPDLARHAHRLATGTAGTD